MKKIHVLLLIGTLLAVSAFAAAPTANKSERSNKNQALDTDTYIDVNKVLMIAANNGAFAYDLGGFLGKTDGLYYPYTTVQNILDGIDDKTVVYASGVWLGAIDSATNDTLITVAEYSQEYFPGAMIDSTFDPTGETNPAYRVYKLYSDSLADNPNQDYLDWPVAQGAPVDSAGNPAIIGDQFLWCVYNDANSATHTNDAGSKPPMGVEMQQSIFAFDREDPLGNIVFIRFKILNKGNRTLENMFVSLWADPDLGGASDDLVGCDTLLSLGYCYNATNNDNAYGSRPPAVGYDFFQGPLDSTGDPADTAKMFGQRFPGFRNLPMSSFNKYTNGTDPHSYIETFRYQNGLDKDGNADPNGTNFSDPGDPVSGSGDLDVSPADRRFMLTTGPFTFRAGDSTEILAAIVVGQGGDRLTAVSALKYFDRFAQTAYDLDFDLPEPPAPPVVDATQLENKIVLTWGTDSEEDPGDFPFEGYTVFQGETANGPWKRIANFDVNNGVAIISDEVFDINEGVLNIQAVKFGSDNGFSHMVEITQDALEGGHLVNNTQYFFRVEAYSYDGTQTPKTLTSATGVSTVPQRPPADIEPEQIFGDTLAITHTGPSDGVVTPIVVDPTALTGHTYTVSFSVDSTLGNVWHLVDETSGDTVLANQTNQNGDNNYVTVDGFLLKVSGPVVDFKSFEVVANANGVVDPPAGGSFGFQGFPSADPDETQQTNGSAWGIHTGDNGGTIDGGNRGSYDAFFSRCTRDGANFTEIGTYDFEIRFTGDVTNPGVEGGYGWSATPFGGNGNAIWVPFELWNIGISTPDNTADDYRLVPWILDNAVDDSFSLESWGSSGNGGGPGGFEHSFSGGDNDPFTDWIYWMRPNNTAAGEAGYALSETELLNTTYDGSHEAAEVFARMVFGQWNGGSAPPFAAPMPEQGTVFRITTTKPNTSADVFTFTAPAPSVVNNSARLNNVRAVPNPYYLYASYDNSAVERRVKFTNLPTACTISIYTITGDFVTKITKDSPESETTWDVENRFGVPVASGIYIYVVEAAGMGQKIGKMAIFTEEEQLQTY